MSTAVYGLTVIDRDISTPVYRQAADILAERIRSGALPTGRVLPSEVQIMNEFGVARLTARKAVALLREWGLAHTVPGKGTYAGPAPE